MDPHHISQLFQQFQNADSALQFILNILHPDGFVCNEHRRLCTLVHRGDGRTDYQCPESGSRHQLSIFTGTSFFGSKISVDRLLIIMLCFFIHLSNRHCELISGINRITVSFYYNLSNSALCSHFCDNFIPIGGPQTIVQLDECIFHRRKNKRGRRKAQIWIFGGIETQEGGRTGRFFTCRVPYRKAETLLPIIRQNVIPGTQIWTDEWGGYNHLTEIGYPHLSVNHSQHYKDPITGCCTNAIEGLWHRLRHFLPASGVKTRKIDQMLGSFNGYSSLHLTFSEFLKVVAGYNSQNEEDASDDDDTTVDVPIVAELEDSDDNPLGITDGLEEPEFTIE